MNLIKNKNVVYYLNVKSASVILNTMKIHKIHVLWKLEFDKFCELLFFFELISQRNIVVRDQYLNMMASCIHYWFI